MKDVQDRRSLPGRGRRQFEIQEEIGISGAVLAALDGERIRARRIFQEIDIDDVDGGVDHTLVLHLGGGADVRRREDGRETGRVDRLRTTTMIPAFRRYGWSITEEVEVLHLSIDDAILRAFAEREFNISPNELEVLDLMAVEDPFVRSISGAILHEMAHQDPHSRMMIDSFEMILAGHILRAYSNVGDQVLPSITADPKRSAEKALAEARAYIAERLAEDVTIADVAAHVGMSPFQFSRSFKAQTGLTPHQYLTDRRLALARGYLVDQSRDLAEIAYACGFSSQAHFTTVFRKHFGTTPGAFRNSMK